MFSSSVFFKCLYKSVYIKVFILKVFILKSVYIEKCFHSSLICDNYSAVLINILLILLSAKAFIAYFAICAGWIQDGCHDRNLAISFEKTGVSRCSYECFVPVVLYFYDT